jgi:hexosaminidase
MQAPSQVPAPLSSDNRETAASVRTPTPLSSIIPRPVNVSPTGGAFTLHPDARVVVQPGNAEVARIGAYLAERLDRSTRYGVRIVTAGTPPPRGSIDLRIVRKPALGDEGYELRISRDRVTLRSYRPAGLFRGVQTIRQLLPPALESARPQNGPWTMATGTIADAPRFAWRGAMLDVARHFFGVADVKRFIDLMALYKLNRLHLHLSDDQGWRLAIRSWPRLATHGGSTAVGGGPGGYYTQRQYSQIVEYAASRYIVTVPEIDMPGHTNAALASYPELNCDGVPPALYTGIEVGFSSLCLRKEITYAFVDDVVRELAALTPGPYIHIGGDEAAATKPAEYTSFVERVQEIVRAHGKGMVGWNEVARARLLPASVVQHWQGTRARDAARQGAKVIMSPAAKAYLDMKYDASTPLGLEWAGHTSVRDAYTWDPATQIRGVTENDVLGVEAPLWSETITTRADVEYLAFPRLLGLAEIAWSPRSGRSWREYRVRLAAAGARLDALGVKFYRASEIDWG